MCGRRRELTEAGPFRKDNGDGLTSSDDFDRPELPSARYVILPTIRRAS